MCPRRGRSPKKARTAAGASAGGDRISDLPIELRARIASFRNFREVVQLTTLSKPWRRIHHHTPVVKISLCDFLHLPDIFFDEENSVPGLLDERSILAVRVALSGRAQNGSASKIDTLRLSFFPDDPRMLRHANRIIALADARQIFIRARSVAGVDAVAVPDAWAQDLPPAARHLDVVAFSYVAPAIAGPGAAALRKLSLGNLVLRECPYLPSLRSLNLDSVTIEAPFAPGLWCPLLEQLDLFCCNLESVCIDIHLQHLRFLEMDHVDVHPKGQSDSDGPPFGRITVDTPELVELDMLFACPGCVRDLKSFKLRAPKLRLLYWYNLFAEVMDMDVGRPGSVKVGKIEFMSVYYRKMTYYRELMMRMLQCLLPNVPPDSVADIARPYLKLEDCPDSDSEDDTVEEKLTCNLNTLMSHGI